MHILTKHTLLLAFIITTSAFIFKPTNVASAESQNTHRLIVTYNTNTSDSIKKNVYSKHSAKVLSKMQQINSDVIAVTGNLTEIMQDYKQNASIESVEVDHIVHPAFAPNDTHFQNNDQYGPQIINAPTAWDTVKGNGTVIAIVDSGVDSDHPDLASKLIPGHGYYSLVGQDYDGPDTEDECGHGTSVAGVAAAVTNNTIGIAGIAPNAQIMPLKFLDSNCTGYTSGLMLSILWAVDNGADVINISSVVNNSYSIDNAINYADTHDVLIVGAAPNTGTEYNQWPAANLKVIGVMGTNSADERYTGSSYTTHPSLDYEVSAPAENVFTTLMGGGYGLETGNSYAAPHVAGVVALIKQVNPCLSDAEIFDIVKTSADDLGEQGNDVYFGYGRVNAYNAVQAAMLGRCIHTGDLDAEILQNGKRWQAKVTITLHDNRHTGADLSGIEILGDWSNSSSDDSCITNTNGSCVLTSRYLNQRNNSVQLTIVAVNTTNYEYIPTNNHDDDNDSNGTTIVVSNPQ